MRMKMCLIWGMILDMIQSNRFSGENRVIVG